MTRSGIRTALMIAVAAVAIWVGISTGGSDLPAPKKLQGGPHLFLSGKYGEVWRVDLAGGVVHAEVPELEPGDPPHHLLARGEALVGYGDETYLLDTALRDEPAVLAGDSLFFLPSAHPDRVWIVSDDIDADAPGFDPTVREVSVDGDVTVGEARPPEGAWPEAAVEAGIVVASGGRPIVWDPETDEIVFTFPSPPADIGPSRGNLVASCTFRCAELHVTEVRSGADHGIGPPPGFSGFRVSDGAFSPDGTTLAVPMWAAGPGKRVQLGLVDVGAATATPVAGTVTDEGFNLVAWSATGSHVFFTGADGEDRTIFVYDTSSGTARVLPAEVGEFYDAAAI